jgi:hypothetical protein
LPLPALALTYKAPSSISTIDCCVCESIICLLKDGYQDEIKKALIARGEYHNEQHKVKKETEIKAYGDDKIYELIVSTRVLPLPALALTYKAPSSISTIDCCVCESIICY